MHRLTWPLVGLASLIIVGNLVRVLLGKKGPGGKDADLPYQKDMLFSPAERTFLSALDQAVGADYRILCKVRLGTVLKIRPGLEGMARDEALNLIQSKHLDFVACNPRDMAVQFVVVLDNGSQTKVDRPDRDDFVDRALTKAGIRIVRIAVRKNYVGEEIRAAIAKKMSEVEEVEVVEDVPPATPAPGKDNPPA